MAAAVDVAKEKAHGRGGGEVTEKNGDKTPIMGTSASHKATCLRRKKKSLSRAWDSDSSVTRSDGSSQDHEVDIMKRLNFDDIDLDDDDESEIESPPEPPTKPARSVKSTPRATSTRRLATQSPQPRGQIRNTCILESPMDRRKSSRKRRIYGVRRDEPKLVRKHRKRSTPRPVSFPLCALQRMFAP